MAGRPLKPSTSRATARRLLVVKVHGMGDAVLVRSVIDHLCRRNPALESECSQVTRPGRYSVWEVSSGSIAIARISQYAFVAPNAHRNQAVCLRCGAVV